MLWIPRHAYANWFIGLCCISHFPVSLFSCFPTSPTSHLPFRNSHFAFRQLTQSTKMPLTWYDDRMIGEWAQMLLGQWETDAEREWERVREWEWRIGKGNGRKIKMKMKIQNEICTFSRMVACPPEQIWQLAKQNEYTHAHTYTHTHSHVHAHTHTHTDTYVHIQSHIANDHRKATKFAYQVRVLLRGCRGGRGGMGNAVGVFGALFGNSLLHLGAALSASRSLSPRFCW